jgi:hypothetical protein
MKALLAIGWTCAIVLTCALPTFAGPGEASPAGIEFYEKKIRPLLSAHCYPCHSQSTKQKGGLTLDSRAGMLKGGDSGPALTPGEPEKSRLINLVRYGGDIKMPPKSKLSDEAIADLVAWIRMGAPCPNDASPGTIANAPKPFDLKERSKHWSLQSLRPGALPEIRHTEWVRNTLDRFILAKLEANGLAPTEEADKRTLLRRITFDLTGLPPTPADLDAFLADSSPDAYERVVDRLLASPRYGERWARHWLDLVRYAEAYGHEFDFDIPEAYQYRDYVVRALNADLPYDQFVTEQIAGDLLPEPRRHPITHANESILGTAFWFLGEARHSPVDVRQDQADHIDNQIDVLGKTFLGLTLACARCHDHKFDAIATKDYYALAGYLESSRLQRAFIDDPGPRRERLRQLRDVLMQSRPLAIALTSRTVLDHLDQLPLHWQDLTAVDPLLQPWLELARCDVQQFAAKKCELTRRLKADEGRAAAFAAKATIFEDFRQGDYRDWFVTGEAFGDGPSRLGDVALREGRLPVRRVLGASAAHSGLLAGQLQGALRSRTFRIEKDYILYQIAGTGGRVNLIVDGYQLIRDPIYGGLSFGVDQGDRPTWAVQNVSMWKGHNAYVELLDDGDGLLALERVLFSADATPVDQPNRLLADLLDDPAVDSPTQLLRRLQTLLREVVEQWRAGTLETRSDTGERLALLNALLSCDWSRFPAEASAEQLADQERLAALRKRADEIQASLPAPHRALAMADATGINEHVFIRGSHKNLGDEVPRRFLEVLAGPDQPAPVRGSGRLELAQRMVASSDPVLPRLLVNRLWLHHFGEGIVRSPDDFGLQGQPPTHPELLDYLASEFIQRGWSIKQMHRLMALSSTYRMASRGDPKADEADPQNKLLHRMPVRRLEAECIRDAMLAVSGRLDLTMEGPGVMPYLTPFMVGRGRPASGPLDGAGRRSLYLAVRRNFLTPMFLAFDFPIPFTTIGRRGVSNVPAQALTMMNNPFVLQQADLWAKRILAEPGHTPERRITELYVDAFARPPSEGELADALAFLRDQGKEYGSVDDARSWSDLCHVLLNVKEFIFVN